MKIANEILQQLGGNKFIVMTGSKNFLADGPGLRMNLSRNKSKAKYLKITLNSMDTYDMVFMDLNGKTVKEVNGAYNDMLQSVFTDVTGLYTKL